MMDISEQEALEIALDHVRLIDGREFKVIPVRPPCLYLPHVDPGSCWNIMAPWGDDLTTLRSSRVIVVSKITGAVLYDGSANDEG